MAPASFEPGPLATAVEARLAAWAREDAAG